MNEDQESNGRRPTLGTASYRARQVGKMIVLFAVGDTPTPNYKVWLQAAPEPGEARTYELWWLAPEGPQIQLLTPFSVHSSFRTDRDLESVRVRDAAGTHEVAVEDAGELAVEETKALVYLHCANQFDLEHEGKRISFTQANIAGDPLLSYGDRYFYGRQIRIQRTPIGELITVTLKEAADGESELFSLLLPATRVSGYETVKIDAMVFETLVQTTIAGPPMGQQVRYEKVARVEGRATYIVS
ncbi:hypothetical protein ENSA5_35560 [Enhygromyxa salina]|uniref:Uncharacterized protein n=1 Tax=Enhygromyxa salina TaxID=215803 RepID=A0A2S9XVA3_9BACT|nr:hypothetical protein [Enhygromyxa salina]PRP96782.1 hypothetical protein ENSA5_35560 [Enhygromyxa salina]